MRYPKNLFNNYMYNFFKKLYFLSTTLRLNARLFCLFTIVVKAAHTFYNGSTSISVKTGDSTPCKRKTERLNTVVCPEEKRKIIGDTFMRVLNTE